MPENLKLRTTFDSKANTYHEIRPNYPVDLFDSLINSTKIGRESQLLEIRPGTGQATLPLAKRGYEITAIELGANLYNIAKKQLANYPNVKLINDDFETITLPAKSFDLIFAATAFHWLSSKSQFKKTHKILKDNAHLAIIETKHVTDGLGDKFFEATQLIYKKYEVSNNYKKPKMQKIADLEPFDIDEGLFELVLYEKFPMKITNSTKNHIKLLSTYSPVIARPHKNRELFLKEIEQLINDKFDGEVTKHYAMTLTIGKKIT